MASEVLITISKDEKERFRLMSEEKYMLDTQSNLSYARQEGEARGMKKGRAEGTLEIARKMKAIGRPESEIAEITGLSPETIKQMTNEEVYIG
jgi:predicted transposase/invertase (TIGR01784 family)